MSGNTGSTRTIDKRLPLIRGLPVALALVAGWLPAFASQLTVNGPAGSGQFGRSVTLLPNGNFVVTDPQFDAPGPIANVGAVYLYAPDGTLISTLRGSTAEDRVGSGGVTVLANGNFVVESSAWRNNGAPASGAATWVDADIGLNAIVSSANSLVGSQQEDNIGSNIVALANGNYVVNSSRWSNGAAAEAGSVTFGSGTTGVTGVVSASNSLVGSHAFDRLSGSNDIVALANGNYVVVSPLWDNGTLADAGAVTFGNGTTGVKGVVSGSNSLVGGGTENYVGGEGVTELANGNYVVRSDYWDNGAVLDVGAVTFCNGNTGRSGLVAVGNSLVGSTADDHVGYDGIHPLPNGKYLVHSEEWDNGAAVDAGAVTLCNVTGCAGSVTSGNSLVGTTSDDTIGSSGIHVLSNGNYLVLSASWDNGLATGAGAATFGTGASGIAGAIGASNSLVGSSSTDGVGNGAVIELANGNYVIASSSWSDGGVSNVGAVTLGNATTGVKGVVSPSNSLVGTNVDDRIGGTLRALSNGHFVVGSGTWRNGAVLNAGAATWVNGTTGLVGAVTVGNSLVGSSQGDLVGQEMTALTNGNYVVTSSGWNNGGVVDAGAATLGNGTGGTVGAVSPSNSLVGTSTNDRVGDGRAFALGNGNYVVRSGSWNNVGTAATSAGAVTFGNGGSGITGPVTAANSLVGTQTNDSVGQHGVHELRSGATINYLVRSGTYSNGAAAAAGALTVGSGTTGVAGAVTSANSLVGTSTDDNIGAFSDLTVFENGNFVENSGGWHNGLNANAGAVVLGLFGGSTVGPVGTANSVLGEVPGGFSHPYDYDQLRNQVIVGQYLSNRVVLHRPGIATSTGTVQDTPDPSAENAPVVFTVAVAAVPRPTTGRVTFTASTGESCFDATSTAGVGGLTSVFSCEIVFANTGLRTIVAEYTGSNDHSYSRSAPASHNVAGNTIFANSFE